MKMQFSNLKIANVFVKQNCCNGQNATVLCSIFTQISTEHLEVDTYNYILSTNKNRIEQIKFHTKA